mmetsp:Transcript_19505/g.44096  ORF Transcript_19505/g.44096 Transcript_19505/m.44096 type:complete len:205 (+) Transcript_19505:116-730(+)
MIICDSSACVLVTSRLRVYYPPLPVAQHCGVQGGDVIHVLIRACVQLAQRVDHFSGLEDVQLVEVGAHLDLHVFDHAPDVRYVCLRLTHTRSERSLSRERPCQHCVSELLLAHAHVQHNSGGELVGGRACALRLRRLNYVYGVPAAILHVPVPCNVLLDQEAACEALVLIPQVDGGGAPLVVQLSVGVEQLVELHLHLPELLRR